MSDMLLVRSPQTLSRAASRSSLDVPSNARPILTSRPASSAALKSPNPSTRPTPTSRASLSGPRPVLAKATSAIANGNANGDAPADATKDKPKPIKVYLQDGKDDLNNLHGNWPLANQDLAMALQFAGYTYRLEMTDGGHSGKRGGELLPDALRWLWDDKAEATKLPHVETKPDEPVETKPDVDAPRRTRSGAK